MGDGTADLVEELRASEARLADGERLAHLGSWVWSAGSQTVTWSAEMYRIFGIDPADGPIDVDRFISSVWHPDDRVQTETAIVQGLEAGEPFEYESRIVRPDGEIRVLHARAEATLGADGALERIIGFGQDITERRRDEDRRREAQAQLARHQAILRQIVRSDPLGEILAGLCHEIDERYAEARCTVVLDGRREQLPGTSPGLAQAVVALAATAREDTAATGRLPGSRADPVVVADTREHPSTAALARPTDGRPVGSLWLLPLVDPTGRDLGALVVSREAPHTPDAQEIEVVSATADLAALAIERASNEETLLTAATVDSLTGLANRSHFLNCVAERLDGGGGLAVMFVDIDRFKWVNDSLGHPTGDRILVEAADRLRGVLDDRHHLLARFGGDEFTVLLHHADPATIEETARRIGDAFVEPFVIDGGEFFLSVSVGTARADTSSGTFELVRDADVAMYAAKEAGGSRHVVFDDRLRQRAVGRVSLESEIRHGIDRGEFELYYQPVLDVRRDRWSGVEALARWNHPTRGLVHPDEFIPLAEETGLIVPLGSQLMDRAVAQAAVWRRLGRWTPVAVNLSALQLADPDFPDEVGEVLRRHDVPADLLIVEVTESRIMEHLGVARGALERFTGLGVRVLIDDFGTGYSSIARLRELPVAGVKVDRAFTHELGRDPSAAAVLGAIAGLVHSLGLPVVAEGIETEAARSLAAGAGCEFLQGFGLARPTPAPEVDGVLGGAGGPAWPERSR